MIFSFTIFAPLLVPLFVPFVVAQSSSSVFIVLTSRYPSNARFLLYSGPDISAQCQSTLLNISSSSEGQCLNTAGLVSVFVTSSNTSVIGPVQNWLTGLCSQGPCTNQTLATLVSDITQGCSSELSSLGITGNSSSITASVQKYYPVVREIVCLKEYVFSGARVPTADSPGVNIFTSNNASQLCLIEELYNIQNGTGTPLTTDVIFSPELIPILTLPQNATCNNCTKEAYNIIITKYPQVITSDTNSSISKQCGADFLSLQPSFIRPLSMVDLCLQMAKHPRVFHRLQRIAAFPSQKVMSHKG